MQGVEPDLDDQRGDLGNRWLGSGHGPNLGRDAPRITRRYFGFRRSDPEPRDAPPFIRREDPADGSVLSELIEADIARMPDNV